MKRVLSLSLVLLAACGDSSSPTTDTGPGTDGGGGDGGGPQVEVVQCGTQLTAPSVGTCSVTAGTGSATLLLGRVLTRTKVYEGGQVLVEGSNITCVGCDCENQSAAATAARVECASGVISPGLINLHDHLGFCEAGPATTAERYDHRHEWRRGINGKTEIPSVSNKSSDKDGEKWCELRHLLAGTTSIVGAGGDDGLLRNLDRDTEGLGDSIRSDTFPLNDTNGKLLSSGCNYDDIPNPSSVANDKAYIAHVSEGINIEARNEYVCLSGQDPSGADITLENVAFVHAMGLTLVDALDMANSNTSVVWSPRSNISLYGITADVVLYKFLGINLSIGTDWPASGSINMLRELACANLLNDDYYGSAFSAVELWDMATGGAAKAGGFADTLGQLANGYTADIAIFNDGGRSNFEAVTRGDVKDVALVMRGGKVLYGDKAVVDVLGDGNCDQLDVCGEDRAVCLSGEVGKSLSALQGAVHSQTYDLFFCGAPPDEPTCFPTRPNEFTGITGGSDADGDGIDDGQDNCPSIFNPIRPLDNGAQPDADSDGQGDACDICPTDATNQNCSFMPDPNDSDADGVPNDQDNCPTNANPNQEDQDNDMIGDACDACPTKPNPGGAACSFTVAELHDASLGMQPNTGSPVQVVGVTVTAIRTTRANNFGFYVREGTNPHQAIFVYTNNVDPATLTSPAMAVGDTITIDGSYDVFSDIQQISDVTNVTKTGTGDATPIGVATVDLTPGSTTAEGWESHLVEVSAVTVQKMADPGMDDDFWVSDDANDCAVATPPCTLVGDFFFDGDTEDGQPAVTLQQTFSKIVGVVNGFSDSHSLDPRTAADLQP